MSAPTGIVRAVDDRPLAVGAVPMDAVPMDAVTGNAVTGDPGKEAGS